jgi:sulfite reductase alpha subunit-like flavoprotein
LSLAWSRDGDKKFYVQDRMREVGRELWTWLAEGANIYVCGDAKRMAKDVERALVDIVAQHRRAFDRRGRQLCRGTQKEGPVPAGRLLTAEPVPISAQIRTNKILA